MGGSLQLSKRETKKPQSEFFPSYYICIVDLTENREFYPFYKINSKVTNIFFYTK